MVRLLADRFLTEEAREFVISDQGLRMEILEGACYPTLLHLRSMEHLGGYTHVGKQAFYDEYGESKSRLKDSFDVSFDGSNFVIENDKMVYGANGRSYNLFELLWSGFGPYSMPMSDKYYYSAKNEPEVFAYLTRTKALSRRLISDMVVGKKMSYYYRYPGITIRYATFRGGMDTGLVTKFHLYVEDAIRKGVRDSIRFVSEGRF